MYLNNIISLNIPLSPTINLSVCVVQLPWVVVTNILPRTVFLCNKAWPRRYSKDEELIKKEQPMTTSFVGLLSIEPFCYFAGSKNWQKKSDYKRKNLSSASVGKKINVLQKCWFWFAFVSSEFPVQFFFPQIWSSSSFCCLLSFSLFQT